MAPIPEPAITPSGSSPKQHQSLAYRLSRRDDDIHRKDVSIAIGIACTTVALAMVAIIIGIVQWNRRRRNTCQKRLPFALERDATLSQCRRPGLDFLIYTDVERHHWSRLQPSHSTSGPDRFPPRCICCLECTTYKAAISDSTSSFSFASIKSRVSHTKSA